jgi:hypothetical protein
MASTYNSVQGEDKELEDKHYDNFNEMQKSAFASCLTVLKGLSYYEAEQVLFALLKVAKKQSKLN